MGYHAFPPPMTTTALATGREQPKDFRKWLRPDRLMAAETRLTIETYVAALRNSDIPERYPYTIRQLLYYTGKTAPQLELDDYARFLEHVATDRTQQDSYLTQIIAALRYHLRLTGKGHLATALALPETTQPPKKIVPLSAEHRAILDACNDYLERQRARRDTKATIDATRSVLRLTIQATGKHPRAWTTDDATLIFQEWNRRQVRGQTINTRVSILRAMLRHYRNFQKDNPDSPFADFNNLPVDDAFRQWPNPAQIDAILTTTMADPRPWARTAMFLLAFSCYRRQTVATLTTAALVKDPETGNPTWRTLSVRTKGGKTVPVPLNQKYLLPILRAAADTSPDGRLLYRDDGTPVDHYAVYRACRAITRRATGTAFRPHDLRRGMARWIYYASGKDLIFTRDFLGHDKTSTTERYLGLTSEEMGTKYDEIAPKLILPGLNKLSLQSGPTYIPPALPTPPEPTPSTP